METRKLLSHEEFFFFFVKREKVNWIVDLNQVGFKPICLKVEFPQGCLYLNTASTITCVIDLFKM